MYDNRRINIALENNMSKPKSKIPYLEVIPRLNGFGFVVIPLNDKKPILKQWNKLLKTPEHFYIFENRNIGILTGHVSGITVLDIDIKDDGLKIWSNISSSYPDIVTPMVKTPSGGIHLYFRYNKNLHSFSRFKLRGHSIGWDLLNNERQVVAPPSMNYITKKKYKWLLSPVTTSIESMPKWLEDYLMNAKSFR